MIRLLTVLVLVAGLLAPAVPVAAQVSELGRQTLGRPYWHLFLAYAIVVLGIGWWVISISRRLARLEARLPDEE